MIVSIIVAVDRAGGIGKGSRLPWRLSTDSRRFRALTMGHMVIMGRRTFESIGKPLAGRTHIVISRRQGSEIEGCLVAASVKEALEMAQRQGENEVFVAGGAGVYAEALPFADRLYWTEVEADTQADVFFPATRWEEWREISAEHQPAGEKDEYPFTFRVFVRVEGKRD